MIGRIVNDFLNPKPRLICICDEFKHSGVMEFAFERCANCNGWMSMERLVSRECVEWEIRRYDPNDPVLGI